MADLNNYLWDCPACTFKNDISRNRCDICGSYKEDVEEKITPWTCPQCDKLNENILTQCEFCDKINTNVIGPDTNRDTITPVSVSLQNFTDLINRMLPPLPQIDEDDEMSDEEDENDDEDKFDRDDFIDRLDSNSHQKDLKDIGEAYKIIYPNGMNCICATCNIHAQNRIREYRRDADTVQKRYLYSVMADMFLPALRRSGNLTNIANNPLINLNDFINGTLDEDDHKPLPATEDALKKLKQFVLNDTNEKILSETCTTCLEQFKVEDEVVELMCNHHFHPVCFLPWMKENHTCPICRTSVEEEVE